MNITAFNIAAFRSIHEAVYYALAVVFIELLAVRITLAFSKKINFDSGLISYALPIGAAILMYFSISGFISAGKIDVSGIQPIMFPLIKSSFLLGLVLSMANPLHLPFWVGWNSFLREKGKLHNQPGMYVSYIVGIGMGSLMALMLFILAGKFLIGGDQHFQFLVTFITSSMYLIFSGYLTFVFIKKHFKVQFQLKGKLYGLGSARQLLGVRSWFRV